MKLTVDQSIKIGDTQSPTVLALSNDIQRAILISASVKRECIRALRGRWTPDATLYIRLFAAGLFLLLRELLTTADRITIGVEYPGHERDIKRDLLLLCRRAGGTVDPSVIHFAHIGKKSPAHSLGLETLRGKRAPDETITTRELLKVLGKK
jgi:hypothetical protein